MPLINSLRESLGYIQQTDAEKNSIQFENGEFKRTEKRSLLSNFWSWFIHLISCTRIPRNKKLDEMTQEILRQVNETQELTDEDRDLIHKSFTKLALIINKNGGTGLQQIKNKAAEMVQTANKTASVAEALIANTNSSSKPSPSSDAKEENSVKDEDANNSSEENPADVKDGTKEQQDSQNTQTDGLIDLTFNETPKDLSKPKDTPKTSDIFDLLPLSQTSLLPVSPSTNLKSNSESKQSDSIEDLTNQAILLLIDNDKKRQEEGARSIVDRMSKYSDQEIFKNLSINKNASTLLFPHFEEDTKCKILARQLWEVLRNHGNYDDFFAQAQKESEEVWKEAGVILAGLQKKSEIKFEEFKLYALFLISPRFITAMFEGFSTRKSATNYGQQLFNFYFLESGEDIQKEFLENVGPEFFKKYINPIPSNNEEQKIWLQFIRALENCDESDNIKDILDYVVSLCEHNKKEELLKNLPIKVLQLLPSEVYIKHYPDLGFKKILETNTLYESETEEALKELWKNIKSSENPEELINNIIEILQDISEDDVKHILNVLLQNVETNDAPFLASLAKIFKVEGKGSLVNYLTSSILDESIPEDVQVACISKFPCSILTQHVLPTLELTEEFNPIHIKILAKLHVEEGTATSSPIHLNWSKISKWYQPDSTSIVPIEDLLPYLISYQKITEFCFPLLIAKYHHDKAKSEQEKRALESAVNDAKSKGRIKLKPSNTDEDETNEAYYQALFTHLEKEPWKALMLINSDIPELSAQPNKEQLVKDFYRSITIWLEKQKDGEGSPLFPACLEIFQKVGPLEKQTKLTARTQVFEGPKKTDSSKTQDKILADVTPINSAYTKLTTFFKQEPLNISKKITAFNDLNSTVKACLLHHQRHASPDILKQDLIHIHPYQLLIGLKEVESRNNILEALKIGIQDPSQKDRVHQFKEIMISNNLLNGTFISKEIVEQLKAHDDLFKTLNDQYAGPDEIMKALNLKDDPFEAVAMKVIVYAALFSNNENLKMEGLGILDSFQDI